MSLYQNTRKQARLYVLFKRFDKDNNGYIDLEEAQEALLQFGVKLNRKETRKLIKQHDLDNDGCINFDEFAQLFNRVQLEQIFNKLDEDNSGTIEINELKKLFSNFGVELGRKQIDTIIKHIDKDNNGIIEKHEFFQAFEHLPELDFHSFQNEVLRYSNLDNGSEIAPSLPTPNQSLIKFLLAGGIGGTASKTITAPLERIKILAQTTQSSNRSSVIFRTIIQQEGWKGLFRGNLAGVIRVFPFAGLVCFSYSILTGLLPKDKKYDSIEPLWRFISGGIAGGFATCCTYPLDVIRARLATTQHQHHNISSISKILMKEGPSSIFRGIRPTLLAIMPFIAIQQSSYDVLKKVLLNFYLPSAPLFLSCGIVAGITAQGITHPIDVIRRQMQIDTKLHTELTSNGRFTTLSAIKTLLAKEGLRGIYRGIVPATIKVAPSVAISLLVRDACLNRLSSK